MALFNRFGLAVTILSLVLSSTALAHDPPRIEQALFQPRADAADIKAALEAIFELDRADGEHHGVQRIELLAETNRLRVHGTRQGIQRVRALLHPPPDPPERPDGRKIHIAYLAHAAAQKLVPRLSPGAAPAELIADVATISIVVIATDEEWWLLEARIKASDQK